MKNDINHVCPPFEEEWKCFYLERTKLVDTIMSNDDNCVILGAIRMHHDTNLNNCTFKTFDRNIDLPHKDDIPLFQCNPIKWTLIASLLAYDYANRMYNVGFATLFNKTLPKLVTWDTEECRNAIDNKLKQ